MTALALAFCIFVWLRTNAFVDFLGFLFTWKNVFYIYDYIMEPLLVTGNVRYPLWLYSNHPNMLTKLLSCPLCLSFWTNLIFFTSLTSFLTNAFVTLLAFVILDKVYQHV